MGSARTTNWKLLIMTGRMYWLRIQMFFLISRAVQQVSRFIFQPVNYLILKLLEAAWQSDIPDGIGKNPVLGESKSKSHLWLFSLHSFFLGDLLIIYLCWWHQYSISNQVFCSELQLGIHPIPIHPVSIRQNYRMPYRFLSLSMFKDKLMSPFSCSKSTFFPVFTILVNRTIVKLVLKVRKLEVLFFHFQLVSKSYWFYPPNISYILPFSVLTVRVFVQTLSISCLIYCNNLLTLSLTPYLLIHPLWLKPEWSF